MTKTTVSTTTASTLALVRNMRRARHAGNCDLADFQFTPPFGKSILFNGEESISGESVLLLASTSTSSLLLVRLREVNECEGPRAGDDYLPRDKSWMEPPSVVQNYLVPLLPKW